MGVVGFLAVIGLRRRHLLPRGFLKSIAMSVALTAATGLVAHSYIDNAAHAGGFVGGLMLGAVYVTRHSTAAGQLRLAPSALAKAAGAVSALAVVVAAAATLWLLLRPA
jgi:membrane associated rhomboid family serine protease